MSETPRRMALVGGFLGAGKTTLIHRWTAWLKARGLKVALVANDQGNGLIDTATLESTDGDSVGEVTGGCFCCRLENLVSIVKEMEAGLRPDIIVAEPVGSCTDLVATVLLPLERVYGLPFEFAPLSVVLDGRRALATLGGVRDPRDFHRDVGYIYRKQMEEAEWLVVNKTDLLGEEKLADLRARLATNFPGKRVFTVSGKTGEGLEEWFAALMVGKSRPGELMEVDYERYGRGEAMLGWYNAEVEVEFTEPVMPDTWLIQASAAISSHLAAAGCKIAHLKTRLENPDGCSRVHQVMDAEEVNLTESHAEPVSEGRLLVNIRAEGAPEYLDQAVDEALKGQGGLRFEAKASFRPGQPEPTHRVAALA